jgi:hypothetical protein
VILPVTIAYFDGGDGDHGHGARPRATRLLSRGLTTLP